MPDLVELPPIANEPISLVLLVRDAEPRLAEIVEGWRSTLHARGTAFEIVLVDYVGNEATATAAAGLSDVKFVALADRKGIGAGLKAGLAETVHPLIATAFCDAHHRPQDLSAFLAEIDRVHFVLGFRAARPVPPVVRILSSLRQWSIGLLFGERPDAAPGWLGLRGKLGALLARLFFGVRLRDVTCAYRLFRREVLLRSPIQSRGVFALVEQLAKVNFAGFYFAPKEIPLPIEPRAEASFREVFRAARRVFSHPDFGPSGI